MERFVHQGCQGSMSRPYLEVDQSAMELVGYQTSCKEMQGIYYSVYLLSRSPVSHLVGPSGGGEQSLISSPP